jgi:class 3 adenylate cyclase
MSGKLTKALYTAGLFDITQDITGGLPVKLVSQWLESEQNYEAALALLAPYKVKGYSVSSDSAGLTKLSKSKTLLEVLVLIDKPKQIVYNIGCAIGGQGVGIWAADNTQMFYPDTVNAVTLVSALLTIQDEVNQTSQVKIGLGSHVGQFYSISGGLYGLEADTIEEIAEEETHGGEIVISQAIYDLLPANTFNMSQREDLGSTPIGNIYRVIDGPRLSELKLVQLQYPLPYSDDFYQDLINYQNHPNDHQLEFYLNRKYIQKKVVVLVERQHQESASNYEEGMLGSLSSSTMLKDIANQLSNLQSGREIKVVGPLGIYVFDHGINAVNFAQNCRQELQNKSIACRIGIDYGDTLIFDLSVGGKDIAGSPVNVASKMAQDQGEFGKIYLSSGMKKLVDVSKFKQISYTVSGVEIVAYEG